MSKPIVIWGAGAIGGSIGAALVEAGKNVIFVDANAAHVAMMNEKGLTIEGPIRNYTQKVTAMTPEQLEGKFETVFLAVKAHHTQSAAEQILPHLTDDGYVVSAQNGLNELIISKIVGEERTVGCFVNFGADILEPGRILLGNSAKVVVGELDGSTTDRVQYIHSLLQIFEPNAELTDNIWGYLWGKMAYGSMLFATALTPESIAANLASEKHFDAFNNVAREVMKVAMAKGVKPLGFNGFDPYAFAPDATLEAAKASIADLVTFNLNTAKSHSGIWRDIAVHKRKTEVDAQIGIIAEIGAEVGVDTPIIRKLVSLVNEIEAGRPQSFDVLDELLVA